MQTVSLIFEFALFSVTVLYLGLMIGVYGDYATTKLAEFFLRDRKAGETNGKR